MSEGSPSIRINTDEILNILGVGARRASSFVVIGNASQKSPEEITDFSLGGTMRFQFWPDPLPADSVKNALSEFAPWIVSCALREVHLHFELFLNELWVWAKGVHMHGRRLPVGFQTKDTRFRDEPSVTKKLERIGKFLTVDDQWLKIFRAMHLLRNCMSHGAGRVRDRDITSNDKLTLNWIGVDLWIKDGDGDACLLETRDGVFAIRSPKGGKVWTKTCVREKEFLIGSKVELEEHELGEIINTYLSIGKSLLNNFVDLAKSRGLSIAQSNP